MSKLVGYAVGALLAVGAATALAQVDPVVKRADELHGACDRGDRAACVRFGIMLGEHQGLREEWRRAHPEWFWWDHG